MPPKKVAGIDIPSHKKGMRQQDAVKRRRLTHPTHEFVSEGRLWDVTRQRDNVRIHKGSGSFEWTLPPTYLKQTAEVADNHAFNTQWVERVAQNRSAVQRYLANIRKLKAQVMSRLEEVKAQTVHNKSDEEVKQMRERQKEQDDVVLRKLKSIATTGGEDSWVAVPSTQKEEKHKMMEDDPLGAILHNISEGKKAERAAKLETVVHPQPALPLHELSLDDDDTLKEALTLPHEVEAPMGVPKKKPTRSRKGTKPAPMVLGSEVKRPAPMVREEVEEVAVLGAIPSPSPMTMIPSPAAGLAVSSDTFGAFSAMLSPQLVATLPSPQTVATLVPSPDVPFHIPSPISTVPELEIISSPPSVVDAVLTFPAAPLEGEEKGDPNGA